MSATCANTTVAPKCHVGCAVQCLFRLADSVPYIHYSSDSVTITTGTDCRSYSRENGIGTITIYAQDNVKVDSFQYRV